MKEEIKKKIEEEALRSISHFVADWLNDVRFKETLYELVDSFIKSHHPKPIAFEFEMEDEIEFEYVNYDESKIKTELINGVLTAKGKWIYAD